MSQQSQIIQPGFRLFLTEVKEFESPAELP